MYGSQRKIWGMLRRNTNKLEIKDTMQTNKIDAEEWKLYFENLYKENEGIEELLIEEDNEIELTSSTIEHILKHIKNRKSPEPDEITNEMLKYGGDNLQKEILTLFRNIIIEQKVPNEWKSSITIPIFKKGQKTILDFVRGNKQNYTNSRRRARFSKKQVYY